MTTNQPTIDYTGRDFETITQQLSDFIRQTRPEVWSDFFESNLGTALIELVAYVGDVLSFGQDLVGTEIFLATLRRYDSALRFARSVGYVPRSATAAEVTMTSLSLPSEIATGGATVPAGTTIVGLNGLQYELLADVPILPTDTVSRLSLFEGASFSQVTPPSNQRNQEVISDNGVVAEGSWDVYVGDITNPLNEWTQVESIKFETSASKTYEAFLDGDGKLHVVFGDNVTGQIPDADITLNYRTTSGIAGNSPSDSIEGSVVANLNSGGTVNITYRNSEGAASGGRDRESVDEMRVNIPAYIKSVDKVITLDDYNTTLLRVAGVALVYTDLLISSVSSNVVKVHVWDEEFVDFTSETTIGDLFSTTQYRRYATVPLDRANDIQAFLQDRTLVSVHNIIVRPDTSWVDVYLGTITYDRAFDREVVHQAVTDAVVGVFQDSTGFELRLSDLYRAIDSALGVLHHYVERMVLEGLRAQAATGWVRLDDVPVDNDWVRIDDGATNKTFEFLTNVADPTSVPDAVPVQIIAGDAELTAVALANAVITNLLMDVRIDPLDQQKVDLVSGNPGITGNTPIQFNSAGGHITIDGMDGGSNDPTTQWTDYRREQEPGAGDKWPPGPYAPGTPYTDGNIGFSEFIAAAVGDTIEIEDGTTTAIFELDDGGGVAPGNIQVIIGATQKDTLDNLLAAILTTALTLQGEVFDSPAPSLRLQLTDVTSTLAMSTSNDQAILLTVGGWLDGGVLEYRPLQDIIVQSARTNARYYDETYLYNNEIRYDSGVGSLQTSVQALNLRRLVFDLVASTS